MPPARPAPASLDAHLGYHLRRVSNQVSSAFARALNARGVSVAEWVVLNHLHAASGARPAALAAALGLTPGAVSKILDKLEAKRWIARRSFPEDNRVQLISLSRRGAAALPRLTGIAAANDARFFACLTPAEHATLGRLLQKIADRHRVHDIPIE